MQSVFFVSGSAYTRNEYIILGKVLINSIHYALVLYILYKFIYYVLIFNNCVVSCTTTHIIYIHIGKVT
jgi:hypothetical protein